VPARKPEPGTVQRPRPDPPQPPFRDPVVVIAATVLFLLLVLSMLGEAWSFGR
jgi:hypothetical protein